MSTGMYERYDTLMRFAKARVFPGMLNDLPTDMLKSMRAEVVKSNRDPQVGAQAIEWLDGELRKREFSHLPWNFDASDYGDADHYCSACLVDMNETGAEKTKDACHLPVREPNGAVNENGVHAAAGALAGARGGVKIPDAEKRKAARKLAGLYNEMGQTLPPAVKNLIG